MGDEEDSAVHDEEDVEDDVVDESFSVSWSSLFLSLFRQCICVCSVASLPFQIAIFEQMAELFLQGLGDVDAAFKFVVIFFGHSLATSCLYLFLGAMLLQRNGRKFTILVCNISHLSLTTFSYFFYGKHRVGILLAILHSVVAQFSILVFHVYIAEMVSTSFRAFFLGFYVLLYTLGNYAEHENQLIEPRPLKRLFIRAIAVASCSSFASIFVPESPFWSASEGQTEEAEQVFYWMRAGSLKTSDEVELNLLLDVAQERAEEGVMKKVLSRSFAIYCIYAILIHVGAIHACDVQRLAINRILYLKRDDYYVRPYTEKYFEVWNKDSSRYQYTMHGGLLFLALSFLIPRKLLFVMSLVSGTLLVIPIMMRVEDSPGLARIGLYCFLIAHAGVIPLSFIIPTEIFPATTREFGFAVAVCFDLLKDAFNTRYSIQHQAYLLSGELERVKVLGTYISYAVSIVGIPVIMVFMPETKGRTMYDLRGE